MLPVAILAGGTATRLRPTSNSVPKSLLTVAGEPFIAHQLRLLQREHVQRVVLCIGHLGQMIRDFVGDGSCFDLNVAYSFDGSRLMGTGGALRRALPLLDDPFFVLYGDSYLDIAFKPVARAFRRSGAPVLMTVFRNEGRWDTSNVVFDGARVVRYDKRALTPEMHYIDYGLGIFTHAALAERSPNELFDLAQVYASFADKGLLAGYEVKQRFYEIGTPAGLAQTEAYLSKQLSRK